MDEEEPTKEELLELYVIPIEKLQVEMALRDIEGIRFFLNLFPDAGDTERRLLNELIDRISYLWGAWLLHWREENEKIGELLEEPENDATE